MRNKLLLYLSICISLLCIQQEAKANHAAGGEIIYTHLGDSAYQFILKFYRDCGGPPSPASFNLCVYNTCTNQQFLIPMTLWTGTLPPDNRPVGSPVSPGCSNSQTTCENPNASVPGIEEYWYTCVITDLPLRCNYWKFGALVNNAALCCRNLSTNIQGQPVFYIETTFNSTVTSLDGNGNRIPPWDNSSPYYSVKPIPYVCLNVPFSYNNGAIDPDGDSLYSQMINPLISANCSATPTLATMQNKTPPINFTTNPFPTNNTFSLGNNNGQMSFTASQIGAGALTIQTKEYRRDENNVVREIGSIMRDVQVQVLPCTTVVPDLDPGTITGGGLGNGLVYGCVGQEMEFCFNVKSSKATAVLLASDNLNTAIPSATINYKNLGTNNIEGCFKWTPTQNDVGNKTFLVFIKDSTCEPPGILFQYVETVNLRIWGQIEASADTSICSGEPAFLGVTGGGNYEWRVLSGTDPSLNNPNISNPVATPGTSTVYEVTSRVNNYCPDLNKDTVKIDVISGPEITGQKDDTTCPNFPIKMDIGLVKEQGVNYTVNWTPATGLNTTNQESATATLKTAQQYLVEVASSINRCKTFDTIDIDVLTGFTIENPDTAICEGESVVVRGTGDQRYSYQWSGADPNAVITDPGSITTNIIPSQIGNNRYTLVASYIKCPNADSVADFDIDLQPIPVATINDDESMCFGDTFQLEAIVMPNSYEQYSYDWTPGAALDFPDRKNPIYSAISVGVTDMQVIVSTPAGCSDTEKVSLNVFAPEFIDMPADTAICPGDSIVVKMKVEDDVEFYWQPDFNISSISAMQPSIWPVAKQQYTAYAVDKFGCLDTADITVNVFPAPLLDIPESATIYPGESYRMDPGGNCLYFTWFPPLGLSNADVSDPTVSPEVNTRYIVHGRTESGCTVTDSIDILVKEDVLLDLPNAFTPGRRDNGTLKLISRGDVTLESFAVYNRWGTKVFETSDINEGWDGTYKGELQPLGVYVYTINAISANGAHVQKQGNVTLVK